MASSNVGASSSSLKQSVVASSLQTNGATVKVQMDDDVNSEAEVEGEPGSSSDSMNVTNSTRVSIPGKMATSAFEIIAVELQGDAASSPGNGNLHHSSLSLGGGTNDTDNDQEQDFQNNGTSVTGDEGLATESESEATTAYVTNDQLSDSEALMHIASPQDVTIDFASTNAESISSSVATQQQQQVLPQNYQAEHAQPSNQQSLPNNSVSLPTAVPVSTSSSAPAPSVSTIKTETGREITILKVEAEFRRGRWACSDYHDHRDTSPPPPNPSPAAGVMPSSSLSHLNAGQIQQQTSSQLTQPSQVAHSSHLPVILEQQTNQQQPQVPQNNLVQQMQQSSVPAIGMTPMNMQHRYSQQQQQQPQQQQQQQTYSSTQQMVEKTAAALSRALSTDPSGYSTGPGSSFASFGHGGMTAPAMVQSNTGANSGGIMVGQQNAASFLSAGHAAPGPNGCVADLAAIEVKVAQALDLVKKYLMAAVRHELEAMQGEVMDLQNKLETVQRENDILRRNVPDDVLQNLLLPEQAPVVQSQMMSQQAQSTMASTPLGSLPSQIAQQQQHPIENQPIVTMNTPSSPSFVLSTSSPNAIPSSATIANIARHQQQIQPQQYYPPQRERSPSASSAVDIISPSERTTISNVDTSSGVFEESSDAVVKQT